MPLQRYKPEQIVTMLRQIEVGIANGKNTPQVCKEAGITVQTFYGWRKNTAILKMDQGIFTALQPQGPLGMGQSIKSHRIDRRTLARGRDVFEVFRFRSLEAVRLRDQRGDKARRKVNTKVLG